MNLHEFERAWQSESHGRLAYDREALLQEVRQKSDRFRKVIWWRDTRETGVAAILIPVWLYLGTRYQLPWTWYLGIPAILFVISFTLIDRHLQRKRRQEVGATLKDAAQSSLEDVVHQEWLLRNVFWWYQLPDILAIAPFFVHVVMRSQLGPLQAGIHLGILLFLLAVFNWFIYRINQSAVRTELKPRREELQQLLRNLEEPIEL